ncbi:MAG: HEAT repeat domain-containing protein [Pirellulaceae bacterium]|nr:HEAT repeat domain-containing protein [Pirellulaceae bacterium]
MTPRLAALLADLDRADTLAGPDQARAARRAEWLTEASTPELAEFLGELAPRAATLSAAADRLLALSFAAVVRERRKTPVADDEALVEAIERLYLGLDPQFSARAQLLAWLATGASPTQLVALVRLLRADPPERDEDVVQALAPLFRRRPIASDLLFPALFDCLASPQLAAPVLDLANFLTREKLAASHPGASRSGELIALLGDLALTLGRLEEQPDEAGLSPVELSRRVSSSVALAVSLCDALAQIGDPAAIGKLNQVVGLAHRRLRTEAAAALAKLGDDDGVTELVRLAEQPVARLRVLAYAQDLGLLDKIEPQWRTPQARAESELVVWLAEPTQFGIPPTRVELFDQRRQFWPGYAAPVDCWLFRFTYVVADEAGERSYSNIGIAGPAAHALVADLSDLSPDDIYAAYAGWQAEHEDIREYDVARLSQSEKLEVERLARRLHDAGYEAIEPREMGYFFGEKALIALASRQGVSGVAVADFTEIAFFPQRHSRRPLGPREAYGIFKGRKLLKTFNRTGE